MHFNIVNFSNDGSSFGMLMPNRAIDAEKYRWGFQNQEDDNEVRGTGDHLNYGERIYDTRLCKWLSIDKAFMHYAPLSPYSFTLNNPIVFKDSEGKFVVGTDGKAVTYERLQNGLVKWSANASADVQRIGNAMLTTSKGTELFDNMRQTAYPITIKIDKEKVTYFDNAKKVITDKNGPTREPLFGYTYLDHTSSGEVKSADITIYEKTIDELQKIEMDINSGKLVQHAVKIDGNVVPGGKYTKEEFLGSVGVHEATHATDKEADSAQNLNGNTEKKPEQNQNQYLKEVDKNKPEKSIMFKK